VEDDADVRTLASAQLISLGYKVVEARNGAEALDRLIEAEKIDVVLCDMVMPGGISGTDLLRRMAGRTSESGMSVPFIFMSGYPEGLTQDAPDAERAPPLLTKPFRMIELARTIRAVLDGSPE
jgi:CheY-like chemotaxis protein